MDQVTARVREINGERPVAAAQMDDETAGDPGGLENLGAARALPVVRSTKQQKTPAPISAVVVVRPSRRAPVLIVNLTLLRQLFGRQSTTFEMFP